MAIIAPGLSNKSTAPALPRPPFAVQAADAIRSSLTGQLGMLIQVTKIENGYVLGISDDQDSMARLIYATDLTDIGQQITAFAVARELEGKT